MRSGRPAARHLSFVAAANPADVAAAGWELAPPTARAVHLDWDPTRSMPRGCHPVPAVDAGHSELALSLLSSTRSGSFAGWPLCA